MKLKHIKKASGFVIIATALSFTLGACNNTGKDPKDAADSANNSKAKTTDSSMHAGANKVDSSSSANKTGFKDDAHFVVDAMNGGMYEIAAAHVALKNSSDKRVKEFASMMIKDHTKWGDEMKAFAKSKNITVPSDLSDAKKDKIKHLSEKGNDKFDVKYMDDMKSDHKDDLDAFKDARKNTKDAQLQAALDKVIPGIDHHLMEATKLDSIIDKEK